MLGTFGFIARELGLRLDPILYSLWKDFLEAVERFFRSLGALL